MHANKGFFAGPGHVNAAYVMSRGYKLEYNCIQCCKLKKKVYCFISKKIHYFTPTYSFKLQIQNIFIIMYFQQIDFKISTFCLSKEKF